MSIPPTEVQSDTAKDSFYGELDSVFNQFPKIKTSVEQNVIPTLSTYKYPITLTFL
jgi:hypothetical protein